MAGAAAAARSVGGTAAEDGGETSGSVSVTGEASDGPLFSSEVGVGVGCALRLVRVWWAFDFRLEQVTGKESEQMGRTRLAGSGTGRFFLKLSRIFFFE